MRWFAPHSAWVALAFALFPCSGAMAQTSASARASAQALFDEGKQLMRDGKQAAACPKLEESLKLDPAIGTRYQLAKCYELTGRNASAWTLYLEVAAAARAAGQPERETFARQEAQKLEPQLSHLTILVTPEVRTEGLSITRNGVALGRGSWNAKLPVDPGRYTVAVTAPGKRPWQGSIDVTGPNGDESLAVPELADAPPVPPKPPASDAATGRGQTSADDESKLTTQQWVGIGLAGGGVIGLGVGAFFAVRAKNLDSESGCDNGDCPSPEALDDNEAARRYGGIATIAGIAGGALLIGGAIVFLAPAQAERDTVVVPALGPNMAGLEVRRTF